MLDFVLRTYRNIFYRSKGYGVLLLDIVLDAFGITKPLPTLSQVVALEAPDADMTLAEVAGQDQKPALQKDIVADPTLEALAAPLPPKACKAGASKVPCASEFPKVFLFYMLFVCFG